MIGAFGTITKGLLKGLENLEVAERVETIQTRLEETCCHSNSSEKPSANTDEKNHKGVNKNNNNQSPRKRMQQISIEGVQG